MSNVEFELWVKEQLEEIIRRLPKQQDNIHALTAERKRAVLVKEAFREYKAGHVTNCACRACEALRAIDAFDKGAENG